MENLKNKFDYLIKKVNVLHQSDKWMISPKFTIYSSLLFKRIDIIFIPRGIFTPIILCRNPDELEKEFLNTEIENSTFEEEIQKILSEYENIGQEIPYDNFLNHNLNLMEDV